MNKKPSESAVSTRPASPEDADFLAEVYATTRREEVAGWGWPREQQESFIKMQYEARRRSYESAFEEAEWSVLLVDGVRAGSMIVHRSPNEVRLVDIAFLPEYRTRGFGSTVISALIEESERTSLPLRLSVLQGNPAIHLYQRLGFVSRESDAMYIEMERHP